MSFLTRMFRAPDPPFEPTEQRNLYPTHSPQLIELFGATPSLSGVSVTEKSAMGISAVSAAVGLISDTIATLPMRTILANADGSSQRVPSWLDDPGGPDGPTRHEFVENLMVSLLLHGNWFGEKVYRGQSDEIAWLNPIPPQAVQIEVKNGRKIYRVSLEGGKTQECTDRQIAHIRGRSLDGVRGDSVLTLARNSFGLAISGERTAGQFMANGARPSAIVSLDDSVPAEELTVIKEHLTRQIAGEANAGHIAAFNRDVKITPWQISPIDAELLESRKFQVAEVARWFNIPPHLIGDVERSTSWGSGLAEQSLAFQRYTLASHTSRIEGVFSRLLPAGRKAEFDYRGLLSGTPQQETELLVKQTGGRPILTVNEARAIQNRPPIEGGDDLDDATQAVPAA